MRVVIPLFPSFTALDAVGPYEVLRLVPGAEVLFVATEKGEVRADSGALAITADAALDEVDACDVLVVPGGEGSLAPPPELVPWLAKVHATTRWTASVCTGSLLLGAAGILDGLDATTHWGAAQRLEAYGARFLPERVVFQDAHRVVTAAGVSSGIDMALALAARLADQVTAEGVQLAIEYDPRPPFHAGAPSQASQPVRARAVEILREAARG
ncbi:DJ-1/PfpI family protein [Streptoalloteichus tenebrarius]|uniref:DJ-1/PfpI family protein n=1 Tax=Streptoalloteichus tenebrarius (strain ATCC 17920 / DSM 40477 / JCM 4838 / CBS 697.72 / NBRC 16177 / NCIMB 11028 / NRRL B-12390 / A12253. 1 / ISP 5477) TaxID=1933 RepID=A0ABT1HUJ6_STRSD|nr:DJ-1/PfpI family protein [Streptoalloteichus tenebrarius]MCP2259203.1 DJ-1/PfpI family protein [Streptoalloteichus tenebrarius]